MTTQSVRGVEAKTGLRETKELTLEVLSPVHIGTREGKITAFEFVAAGGWVYLIDEERLGVFLREKNLIDAFIFEVRKGPFRMERFLRERAKIPLPEVLGRIVSRKIPGGSPEMQEFRPLVRDGIGRVFLPGSSLKGVFRTALLYRMLKMDSRLAENVARNVERGMTRRLNQRDKTWFSSRWLQREPLQRFSLPGGKEGPNQDILRCLAVKDSYPLKEPVTRIIPIHFLSILGDGLAYWSERKDRSGRSTGRDLAIWVEAVVEGSFSLEVSWDRRLFEHFQKNRPQMPIPVTGLDDLIDAVQEMNHDLAKHEQEFFSGARGLGAGDAVRAVASLSRWYEGRREGLFRVGFGSGMLSTTVNLRLPLELRQKIRDVCGSGPRPGDPAPKSRRVWRRPDQGCVPMGWLRIEGCGGSLGKVKGTDEVEQGKPDLSVLKKKFRVREG